MNFKNYDDYDDYGYSDESFYKFKKKDKQKFKGHQSKHQQKNMSMDAWEPIPSYTSPKYSSNSHYTKSSAPKKVSSSDFTPKQSSFPPSKTVPQKTVKRTIPDLSQPNVYQVKKAIVDFNKLSSLEKISNVVDTLTTYGIKFNYDQYSVTAWYNKYSAERDKDFIKYSKIFDDLRRTKEVI